MTAPLFLVRPEMATAARVGDEVVLAGSEGRHAVAVARTQVGERIDLGDGLGTVLRVQVEAVAGRESLRARVLARREEPEAHPRVVVVQALPKGDRGELAVEALTEVGVDVIVPWQAERCVARWTGEKARRGPERWAAVARAAGKQSRRARFPEVTGLAGTEQVRQRVEAAGRAVLLHEEAAEPLSAVAWPRGGDLVLVVGPEGGLSADEVAVLSQSGASPARMGPSVMRTSTAGVAAAAVVLCATGRWG